MIRFWDQTLRDGEQSPGVRFSPSEKLRLAREMDEAGIAMAEVGFPVASKDDFRACKLLAEQGFRMRLICPARCRIEDVDAVADTGVREIALFISTSPQLMRHSLRMKGSTVIDRISKMIEYSRDRGLYVHAVSEDTMRSRPGFILPFFKSAVTAGAKGVVITDTVGIASPEKVRKFASLVHSSIRAQSYSVHVHDDLGLATANTLAAVEAGFNVPQTTINGIGERSGNASFAEVCLALELLYNRRTNIRIDRIYRLARLVEKFSGVPIPSHKPVIGGNSFSHEAGIHVAALLRNPQTYEPYPPEKVGRRRSFRIGKHTGSRLIQNILGKNLDQESARTLTNRLKRLQERRSKREIYRLVRLLDKERSGISEQELRRMAGNFR
jgi:2-isopropylmalate synthase